VYRAISNEYLIRLLSVSFGNKWLERRRLLTPSFHFDILKNFIQIMNEQAETFVEILEKVQKENEHVDIQKHASLVTLDIICGMNLIVLF
jgi:cytochrome P450